MTTEILKELGFIPTLPTVIEEDFSYDHYRTFINGRELDCTIEYNQDGTYHTHYFELNGEMMQVKNLTIDDINYLKSLL